MSSNFNRPRGRPPIKLIERLRVSIWSTEAQSRSNLDTAEEFEQVLNASNARPILTKGQWSRHLRGDVSLQGSKSSAQRSLVSRVEQLYPGTMKIFTNPVWRLLDFEVLLGPRELQQSYRALDEDIWENFHFSQEMCNEGTRPEDLFFWRISPTDHEKLKEILDSIQGLNGVSVGLIEARMAYLAQKPMMFIFYMLHTTRTLRNCPGTMPSLANQRGQSLLLTLEGLCVLQTVKLLTHLPLQADAELNALSEKGLPTSVQTYAFDLYDSWEKRCIKHICKLSPKAFQTFQLWNSEILQYQGLINLKTLKASD